MISISKPEFKTIQPADKVEQALSALQEFIISGNLKPGTEPNLKDSLKSHKDVAPRLPMSLLNRLQKYWTSFCVGLRGTF